MKQLIMWLIGISIGLIFSVNVYSQHDLYKFEADSLSKNKIDSIYHNLFDKKLSSITLKIEYSRIGQRLVLTSIDKQNFAGVVINRKILYSENKKENINKEYYIYNFVELRDEISSEIGKILMKKNIDKIPSDNQIKGWKRGYLHCSSEIFRIEELNEKKVKIYSCLRRQNDTLEYVKELKEIGDTIKTLANLSETYHEFEGKLERGKTYSTDGFIMQYFLTDNQKEYLKRDEPRRNYLKSIKDTVDNYLQNQINQANIDLDEYDCFDEYYLTFSKQGKLIKISVNTPFWERVFEDDFLKCKRLIKKVFKDVKINFVDLKYEIERTISIRYNNKIILSDRTIY